MKIMEGSEANLTAYIPEVVDGIDPNIQFEAIIICPGGAYWSLSQRCSEPGALHFLGGGRACFLLNYTIYPNGKYPQALLEISKAVAMIRENASKWHINPDKIYVMGLSAGGHLAGSLATMWHEDFIKEELGIEYGANKPNGAIICYPVISANEEISHSASFEHLLMDDDSPEMREYLSLENRVSDKTPPIFIWHAFEDDAVNVRNSIDFTSACRQHNVPVEFHLFPCGGHGFAMSDTRCFKKELLTKAHDYVAKWSILCSEWLDMMSDK